MPSLNLDLDYFDHPKIRRLIRLLGRGAAELPLRLWAYCGKYHSDDGVLAGYSAQEIEDVVRWWGKAGDFVSAMRDPDVRFLEPMPGGAGFRVNGLNGPWREEQGHFVLYRERAKKAAEERWRTKRQEDAPSIARAKPKQSQGSTGQGSAGQDQPAPAGTSSPAPVSAARSGANVKELGGDRVSGPAPNRVSAPKRQSENPWQRALDHIHAGFMARKKVPPEWSGHVVKRLQVKCRRFLPEGVMALWDEACRRLWYADRAAESDLWNARRWRQEGHTVLFFLDVLTEYLCESPAWTSGRDKYLAKTAPDVAALAKSVIKKVSDITQPNDPKEASHEERRADGTGGNPGPDQRPTAAGGAGRDPGPDRGGGGPAHEHAHA